MPAPGLAYQESSGQRRSFGCFRAVWIRKSFLALDIGARIACGLEWFGLPVTAGGVVYVAGEGSGGLRLRIKAWRERFAPDARAPFAMIPGALDLRTDASAVEALAADIRQHGETMGAAVDLIVLDTFSRMLGGGTDAEPRDVAAFLQNIEKLKDLTNAHILIVHHTGKDRDKGMRGSTMLRDFADTVIEISRARKAIY